METPAKENIKHNQLLVQQALAAGAQAIAALFGPARQIVSGAVAGGGTSVHFDDPSPFLCTTGRVLIVGWIGGTNTTVDDPYVVHIRNEGVQVGLGFKGTSGHAAGGVWGATVAYLNDNITPGSLVTFGLDCIANAGTPSISANCAGMTIINWPTAT